MKTNNHICNVAFGLGLSAWLVAAAFGANPPTDVTVTPLSSTSARICWELPSGTIQAIQIWQSCNGETWELGENVPPDRTCAVRDGLPAGDNCCFKVRVQIGGQWSPFSPAVCYPPVPPPTNVRAKVITDILAIKGACVSQVT